MTYACHPCIHSGNPITVFSSAMPIRSLCQGLTVYRSMAPWNCHERLFPCQCYHGPIPWQCCVFSHARLRNNMPSNPNALLRHTMTVRGSTWSVMKCNDALLRAIRCHGTTWQIATVRHDSVNQWAEIPRRSIKKPNNVHRRAPVS